MIHENESETSYETTEIEARSHKSKKGLRLT